MSFHLIEALGAREDSAPLCQRRPMRRLCLWIVWYIIVHPSLHDRIGVYVACGLNPDV